MNITDAEAFSAAWLADETDVLKRLLPLARLSAKERQVTESRARRLVQAVRAGRRPRGGIDAFLQEYDLSSEEGVLLMCLAEALLRIPDKATADALIRDKIGGANWQQHLGHSSSVLVNASSFGLMLTGKMLSPGKLARDNWENMLDLLIARSGEPIIRQAIVYAMRIMGRQFVLGRSIGEALEEGKEARQQNYRFSFDMLGEAACTMADANRYVESYARAISEVAAHYGPSQGAPLSQRPSISVKLSALHPRYEEFQRARVMTELRSRLLDLALQARDVHVALSIDAEESERLLLSLDLYESVWNDPQLACWEGFGPVIQAYQKRALPVIDWFASLMKQHGRRIPVRLVKGAYWDTEIKRHQELGTAGYPVFTRKAATDVSYLACARRLLDHADCFYPQFATHNAHTVAAISAMAPPEVEFEFQRLHGMGAPLYEAVQEGGVERQVPVRIYAPVGSHKDLLAYLVRRLLENGANSSFVHRLANDAAPIADIIADPVDAVEAARLTPHPLIPLPAKLYHKRKNAIGPLLADAAVREPLLTRMEASLHTSLRACPIINGKHVMPDAGPIQTVYDPADCRRAIGTIAEADEAMVNKALTIAENAAPEWDRLPGPARAAILEKAADLYEAHLPRLMALCIREAGKTLPNALADVREAIDFLRYYAGEARRLFDAAQPMPGPTGEDNQLSLHGRGVFACIAPWNFPVAIFTGQISAALEAGNSVIAKPAEQTGLCAAACVELLLEAGVPGKVLHFLPGAGERIGTALTRNPGIAGVAFTGSLETAKLINRQLSERPGPLPTLIAETGGQNAMIVDSSALPEQVTRDVLTSAFGSAGQRCSALRILFLQEDVADNIIDMITGAMAELRIGDPMQPATDIGPVIDKAALSMLEAHISRMQTQGTIIYRCALPDECVNGIFFAPTVIAIKQADILEQEVFGPVLHIIRYAANQLDAVCDSINALDYGLTLGIHSRIEEKVNFISSRVKVGNTYVNRNQIGAVVGVQPFGGEGLSGTGPKAGGPHYLPRFAVERSLSVNTTASGGNASLMSLDDYPG